MDRAADVGPPQINSTTGAANGSGGLSLRRLGGAASTMFGGSMVGMVAALACAVIAGRALGPAGYGLWGAALGLAASVRILAGFNTSDALTRELTRARVAEDWETCRHLLSAALWLEATVGVLASAVTLSLVPWVARHGATGPEALPAYTVVAVALLFGTPAAVVLGVLREQGRYRLYGLVTSAPAVAQALVVLWLSLTGRLTIGTMAWTYLAVNGIGKAAVETLTLLWAVRQSYHVVLWPASPLLLWRATARLHNFWTFIGATWITTTVSGLVGNMDIVVLGFFRPAAELGCYRIAKQMVTVTGAAVSVMTAAVFRDLSEMVARGQLVGLRARLRRIQLRSMLPAGALWVLTTLPALYFVRLAFGPEYGPAAGMFAVLNLGFAALVVLFWSAALLQAKGEMGFLVYLSLIGGTLTVGGLFAAAWWQGAMGTAAVTSLYQIGMNTVVTVRLYRSLAVVEREAVGQHL